jgi:hypothetical protein
MTLILLQRLAYLGCGQRVVLPTPWNWWRTRLYPDESGNYFRRFFSGDHDKAAVIFGGDDAAISNPPVMRITTILHTGNSSFGDPLLRTVRPEAVDCTCEIVWTERPGEGWHMPGGNTCCPGDYTIVSDTVESGRPRPDDAIRHISSFALDTLRWPLPHYYFLGYAADVRHFNREDVARISRIYGIDPALLAPSDLPRSRERRKDVLPEKELIDDIDRLVNEQIRPGPVDDYSTNRYPECGQCGHDWHGLDCGDCGCLNTDWLRHHYRLSMSDDAP